MTLPLRPVASALALVFTLIAATPARAADPIEKHDVALLVAAWLLIGADAWLSLDHTPRADGATLEEKDPLVTYLFGNHPTKIQYAGLGLAVGGLMTLVSYNLPEDLRWIPPTLVIAVELPNNIHTYAIGGRFRF